jgi:hypothetical protein
MQGEYRGDFTRDTFDSTKHFSRVLMQQGRVQVDADWNEQASILLHYLRTLATDLMGPHWGPKLFNGDENKGFLIDKGGTDDKNDFLISAGRYYVDGILCENDDGTAYREQSEFPLDNEDLKTGVSLVYLDVWERHITQADDGLIRETALGGPDTATRAKVVWQVKVIPPAEFSDTWSGISGATDSAKQTAIEDFLKTQVGAKPRWITTGTMRAKAKTRDRAGEPCSISPESRYRGLENHLYRVEIHNSGPAWNKLTEKNGKPGGNIKEAATFKWSRDNSSIDFPLISLDDGRATLASLGRDNGSTLRINDWVEIIDDSLVLRGSPAPLRRVESIDALEMSVTLKNPEGLPEYDEEDIAKHPRLRRWDFRSEDDEDRALPVTEASGDEPSDWIALEDGIQIQFPVAEATGDPRTYRSGDYWLIPARTATGDVEWKSRTDSSGRKGPEALPPHGIDHHYAPLAVITVAANTPVAVNFSARIIR